MICNILRSSGMSSDGKGLPERIDAASLVAWSWVGGVGCGGGVDYCAGAGQAGEEWGHFQRHLFASGGHVRGSHLDQFHTVIPWIEFDPSTQRQGCGLIEFGG